MLNRVGIGYRLGLAFGILILLLVFAVGAGTYGIDRIAATGHRAIDVDARVATNAMQIEKLGLEALRYEKDIFIDLNDPEKIATYKAKWDDVHTRLKATLQAGLAMAATDQRRQLYQNALNGLSEYQAGFNKIYARIRSGDIQSTAQANNAFHEYKSAIYQLENNAEAIDKAASAQLSRAVPKMETVRRDTQISLLAFAGIAIVLAIVLSYLITRSVSRPLRYAVDIIEDIAQGNLRRDVSVTGKDEVSRLLAAMSSQRERLSALVLSLRNLSNAVYHGAQEIASGNDELSSRTQQQAASLQETAASMEEMTSTVRQNAENARQADQLSRNVRTQASEGGQVVDRAVRAMSEISDSSHRITEIVSLIDDIAFQTNLLALNASVEAARAGEQGRGFAVVASEVRNLASRSATAAKDIKTLVDESAQKVADGSKQVELSGKTLNEIIESINQVSNIISDIATAGSEQAQGIDQVNTAVSQMDSVTQQNAALVEESAAASASLEEQAQQLNTQIAFFKLPEDATGARDAQPSARRTVSSPRSEGKRTAPPATKPKSESNPSDAEDWATF
ncbi:methyl-accepting chemotaxis protein [Salinisphaera hydrothermalis]|uniref:methyl-accepting chemotaxis protein n=1 Tax=Salinisphaera hydrothermalis TaxID=563188 RepID=UPI0033409661